MFGNISPFSRLAHVTDALFNSLSSDSLRYHGSESTLGSRCPKFLYSETPSSDGREVSEDEHDGDGDDDEN